MSSTLFFRSPGKKLPQKVRCRSLHTGIAYLTVWHVFRKATVNVGWNKMGNQCHAVKSKVETLGTQSSRFR